MRPSHLTGAAPRLPRDGGGSNADRPGATRQIAVTETDPHRLKLRNKQLGYGKNTRGYDRYSKLVPRHKRKWGDPQTPDPTEVRSKRSWEGLVRIWRRKLHDWDPPAENADHVLTEEALRRQKEAEAEAEQDAQKARDVAAGNKAKAQSAAEPESSGGLTMFDDFEGKVEGDLEDDGLL